MPDTPNYDLGKLQFVQWRPGFVWGEAVWGESVWGVDTVLGSINAEFTSLVIDRPGVVEQGLFVHAEPVTATLTTTDPDHMALRGQRLQILYDGVELFYGTVADASMVEAVDVGQPHMRGNTAVRTHRVTLRLQQGTEVLATAKTPPRLFTTDPLATRLQSLLGTTTAGANGSSDVDVDSGVMENVGPWITDSEHVDPADDKGTLLDTTRSMLGRVGKVLRPFFGFGYVDVESISKCAATSLVASTLRFTDSPTLFGVAHMSYTSRQVSEDVQLFTTGVAVTISAVRYGPYDCANQQRVAEVDLGVMDFTGRDPQVARNFAATCPLRKTPHAFTSKITAPAQPALVTPAFPVPRLAVLHRDGVEEQVAVIGVTHTITPAGWLMDFDCAPAHLLTRHSDLDPSPVTDLTVTQPGGAGTNVVVEWRSPKNMPTDVPIYRQASWRVASLGAAGGEHSTDTVRTVVSNVLVNPVTEPPGTLIQVSAAIAAGVKDFYVQYSSDPSPASGVFDATYRQGQTRRFRFTVA